MGIRYDPDSYARVLKLASAPSWQKLSQISKITDADIFLVGLLGFIILAVVSFLPGGV